MKQNFILPNIITAFGLSCGLFVIFRVSISSTESGLQVMLFNSVLLILLAAFADLLDGAIARITNTESYFGSMFDALSDTVSFGVAPAVLFLKTLPLSIDPKFVFFATIAAMLFTISGILRLVRFNVHTQEIKANRNDDGAFNKSFIGLPIPAAAIAVISLNLFLHSGPFGDKIFSSISVKYTTTSAFMIIIGYLMISKYKFPSLKALHLKVPTLNMILLTVVVAIFVLYGILYYFNTFLFVCSMGYIVVSSALNGIKKIASIRAK